jgi:hypothetical protein
MTNNDRISIETFTVRGHRNGSLVHVTWTRGELSGDPPTVDAVAVEAEIASFSGSDRLAQRSTSMAGKDPLADVLSTARLVCQVIDRVSDISPAELADALQAELDVRG